MTVSSVRRWGAVVAGSALTFCLPTPAAASAPITSPTSPGAAQVGALLGAGSPGRNPIRATFGSFVDPGPVVSPLGRWPLAGRVQVARRFQLPVHRWGSGHRGVDLVGTPGAIVGSALAGHVSFVGVIGGVPSISVDHGASRTTYQPVLSTLTRGARVNAGGPLGSLVLNGGHCLPKACLHWGLITPNGYRDPLALLGLAPLRLYPNEPH